MNSYPPELLAQLAPVMFVAGLDTPLALIPQSPGGVPAPPPKPQDAFAVLTLRLRDAFLSQRKPSIWHSEKSKTFQILPVDKAVRFPPRKLSPQGEDPINPVAHSPLSPLTPSSPLYPDGLIAPIWIRKHTSLVPSVFVLFLRLFELPPLASRSPLDPPDADREREREQEERRRDTDLSAEIAVRKRSTNERGIKLTVVLMASRRMLDDPSLDARLTYIRRQSGLDSRAALFVLSPVSVSELNDFVRSLQDALYEPAVEYYTAHSKRVRRKRNRHSQAVSSYTPANQSRLRPEGWTVRYEYKMACFAEFRSEDEVALKHYQDAYAMLVIMFGSTAILPPRTKRWAEAKVLADSINVKVCKLYLYNNEHALALSHHSTHMRRFADFSRGWGIGEETFEFWSWMARQHRILAELLEQGTRTTLTIPSHRPTPALASSLAASITAPAPGRGLELDSMRSLGLNPSHALQHPGFYYYMAARCTEKRRERFLALVEAESTQSATAAPGYANEKKVDHLTIILELYTKSYELFKKYSPINSQNLNQGRLTLWIAYRIAQTYYESGKFDMAVRFFERIAKTYRREKWASMLRPLLTTWYACAQELGAVELCVKLLVEMMGYGATNDDDGPETLVEDLVNLLKTSTPSTEGPLLVDLSESEPIFNSIVLFWSPEVKVDEVAAFQLSLIAPSDVSISALPITSLAIHFTTGSAPLIIRHSPESETPSDKRVRRVDVGHVSMRGDTHEDIVTDLRWTQGANIVFAGTLSCDTPAMIKVSNVVLTLEENSWKVEIPLDSFSSREESALVPKWLRSVEPVQFFPITRENYSSMTIRHRPHLLQVLMSHQAPAFVDEEYPIVIEVTNNDDRDMDVLVDVLLQPTEIDHTVNHIAFGDERSTGLIKGVSFGVVAPGVTVLKTLYLVNTGAGGDRTLDISIQSRAIPKSTSIDSPIASPASSDAQEIMSDTSEVLQTLTVPTVNPIAVSYSIAYRRALKDRLGLSDLMSFSSDFWDDGEGGEALVTSRMEAVGPWSIEVLSVKLVRKDGTHARIVDSAIDHDSDDTAPTEYLPGDEFSDICRITLAPDEEQDFSSQSIPGPGVYEVIWRRLSPNGNQYPPSTSLFLLPSLQPPTDGLIALLSMPPSARLHRPITMSLKIRNQHPSRSANITVQLEPDAFDAFVVSGLRSGRVPILLPGGEEQLIWRLIPIECGYLKVPKIKVVDRRSQSSGESESEGEVVRIVDVRWDRREVAGVGTSAGAADARRSIESSSAPIIPRESTTTVLVLP